MRRARNPLYFSLRSLALLLFLVLLISGLALALVFALRRAPATAELAPVIEVVEEQIGDERGITEADPTATYIPEVEVILAAETPGEYGVGGSGNSYGDHHQYAGSAAGWRAGGGIRRRGRQAEHTQQPEPEREPGAVS